MTCIVVVHYVIVLHSTQQGREQTCLTVPQELCYSVWFWRNYCIDVHRMESYSCLSFIYTYIIQLHILLALYIGLNDLQIIGWGNGLHTPLELKGMNRKVGAVNQFCLYGLEVPGFNSATDCWTNRDHAKVYDCIHPACMRPAEVDS